MGNSSRCSSSSQLTGPAPGSYYPINAKIQQEQWRRHAACEEPSEGSAGRNKALLRDGNSDTSGSNSRDTEGLDLRVLREDESFPWQDESSGTLLRGQGFRVCGASLTATVVALLFTVVGFASIAYVSGSLLTRFHFHSARTEPGGLRVNATNGWSLSQMHMPLIPLLGGEAPKDRSITDKQERKLDRDADCCRGHHAKCRACEAGLSVTEYCERQKWPMRIPGCREAVKDATTIPKNQTVLPASGPMPADNPFKGAHGEAAPIRDCCTEKTARCVSCNIGMTVEQYCAQPDLIVKAVGCGDAERSDTGEEASSSGDASKGKATLVAKIKKEFANKRRKAELADRQRRHELERKEANELQKLQATSKQGPKTVHITVVGNSTHDDASMVAARRSEPSTTKRVAPKVVVKLSPPTPTHAASTTTPFRYQPTLFCFSLMLPWGYEPSLLKMQLRHKRSIFACEATSVYSSEIQDLGGIKTEDLGIDLHCPLGGVFHTVMNTPIFVEVWKRLVKDAMFRHYDWTVKVDPDAVFFPERLRHILGANPDPSAAQAGNGTFLNNCGFGLHGPLEVLSRRALEVYDSGNSACDRPPQEDVYLQTCLLTLGVTQVNRFNLLAEDHCHFKEWKTCKSGHVSFHPFKKIKDYEECLIAVEGPIDT